MTVLNMNVECPRCKKIWQVQQGITEIDCDCHLFCDEGEKPTDCSVTTVTFSGEARWPTGLHNNPVTEGEDVMHRTYYCSTHSKYYYKTPILIPVDWTKTKLPEKLQWHGGRI